MLPVLVIGRKTGSPGLRPARSDQRASASHAVGISGQGMTMVSDDACDPFDVGKVITMPRSSIATQPFPSRMAKKLARRKNLYFTGRSRLPEDPSWDDGKQAGFLDFADFLDLPIAARTVPD